MYDVLNHCYADIEIDTAAKSNEANAAEEMLEKNAGKFGKLIYMADRGYEKYQLMAFLTEKKIKYIIRVKDISSNGILSTMNLEDKEFDLDLEKVLTRLQTNEVKQQPDKYVRIMSNQVFQFRDFYFQYGYY